MIVFSLVMGGQSLTHQGHMVGDKRCSRAVPSRDGPDQARHQPELAVEHPVNHEHVTRVGVGLLWHYLPSSSVNGFRRWTAPYESWPLPFTTSAAAADATAGSTGSAGALW